MNPSIIIRDATAEDVDVLARIIRNSFRDVAVRFALTPENCPRHPSNCTTEWIESDRKRGVQYFILSKDAEPAGCVGLESPTSDLCYLERLSVLPEMRRKGYGRALALHALERAGARGARRVGIGVIADQTELKAWYSNLGFIETERKKFRQLPFEVAFMEFRLGTGTP